MNNKPKLWVLGNGQLGAMLKQAANPLAVDVEAVDIVNPSNEQLPIKPTDIITAEREMWPISETSKQLSEHPNFINRDIFALLADRYPQKSMLDRLNIATAPWQLVTDETNESGLHSALGDNVLLKRRTGGYDGKGQHWLRINDNPQIPDEWNNECIAEQGIPFDEEVSLVGVRLKNGRCVFYPLTLNHHQNGILMMSISSPPRLEHLQSKAEAMLSTIMNDLDYVGVMAMECFRVGDKLLVNELAPRVHNSGHWTQAGCAISQFELHVRAMMELPVPELKVNFQSAMVNLIGVDYDEHWLELPNAELYWYRKEVRSGRKVGHINLSVQDKDLSIGSLNKLKTMLPEHYQAPIDWLITEINA
ncbi:5-(carboxyamino)imidazole ribonucleotide synthase [Parashewanella curva]|uniref:N5-carboxyaminoimidazole ribonucleotide synthase n=1 Tax=Parashewanella curva TaxID=2338552 RepID=A0A3L8Q1P9_9GAMM|nr:5-(carboxyamino)imidazole ribonucleotide synthase [Parashewanella curva]RLV61514.1 5-(carboxyamino)imidazole ribonucleotide synthase [Parashewanella curva]